MSGIRKSSRLRVKRIREALAVSPTVEKSPLGGCTFDLIPGLSQESPPISSPQWKKKSARKSVKNLGRKFVECSYVDSQIPLIDTSSLRESEVTLFAAPVVIDSSSGFLDGAPHVSEAVVNLALEPIVDPISESVVIVNTPQHDPSRAVDTFQPSTIAYDCADLDLVSLHDHSTSNWTFMPVLESSDTSQPSDSIVVDGFQREVDCNPKFVVPLLTSADPCIDTVITAEASLDFDDSSNVQVEPQAICMRDGGEGPCVVESTNMQPRIFKEVDRNLLEKCMDDGENPSVRNNRWLRNRFNLWKCETNNVDSKSIEDYEIEELAMLMTHFFLALCKDSGERYPSGSIGNLYNSLNRILRRAQKKRIRLTKVNEVEFSLRKCVFFDTVTRAVEAAMKLSIDSGANKPRRKVKVITFVEESLILAHESHQMHHPRGLQKRIAWYCTVVFLIRGYQELHDLEYKNFQIKINPVNGKKFVKYTEGTSKNHKATVTKFQQEQFRRPVISYDEDVVACWVKYDTHLANDMKSGAFFLGALDEHRTNVWFKRTNVGIGTIRTWVREMAKVAGVTGDITNKSGRATAITRMSLAGVPKHVMCGVTSHKNPNMLDRYDATLDLEHEAAQRASRGSYLGSPSMMYDQCRESTVREYRQLQIAPVAVSPTITNVELSAATTSHPRVTDVTSSMPSVDINLWSPERSSNHLPSSNRQATFETPTHEYLQSTLGVQAIYNTTSSGVPRQLPQPQYSVALPSIPEDVQFNCRSQNPSVFRSGADQSKQIPNRPYGQYRRIPPQFVRGSRVMDRPNPYNRSQPISSPMMPLPTQLRNDSMRDCRWAVNDQVTGENMQRQVHAKFTVATPALPKLNKDSVEINRNMFSPDEELLSLDWDANSLSKRSVSSPSSLIDGIQIPNSICNPVADIPTVLTEGSPASGVPPIAHTPSTKDVHEVVPYIEHATATAPGTIDTTISASVSAPVAPNFGGSVTLAPVAGPFGNVTHVNFVFTKEMDFGALMAALGK